MKNRKIVVIGSSNTDMVIQSNHLPTPGETVLGGEFIMNPGGKGANQAVAAAKLSGDVVFIGKVGSDIFGEEAIKGFHSHNINTEYMVMDDKSPSGVALIMVDGQGENCISVALGANLSIHNRDIDNAKVEIAKASFVLIQLEIPLDVVEHTVALAHQENVKVVLNPAPAQFLSDYLLSLLYIITPNETEAEILTGVKIWDEETAREASRILKAKGVEIVIITLGSQGAFVLSNEVDCIIPCAKVNAVDTTAAGDTFNGALVVGLSEGMELKEAVNFAHKAAAYSVTKMGAQVSSPYRSDLKTYY